LSQAPVQDDFYLLDVIGGACVSALHPTKPFVAYTSGKSLGKWSDTFV